MISHAFIPNKKDKTKGPLGGGLLKYQKLGFRCDEYTPCKEMRKCLFSKIVDNSIGQYPASLVRNIVLGYRALLDHTER